MSSWTQNKTDEYDRLYNEYCLDGEECEEAATHALDDLGENEDD